MLSNLGDRDIGDIDKDQENKYKKQEEFMNVLFIE